jgi:hypothetical protein
VSSRYWNRKESALCGKLILQWIQGSWVVGNGNWMEVKWVLQVMLPSVCSFIVDVNCHYFTLHVYIVSSETASRAKKRLMRTYHWISLFMSRVKKMFRPTWPSSEERKKEEKQNRKNTSK